MRAAVRPSGAHVFRMPFAVLGASFGSLVSAADLTDMLNALRARGCGTAAGTEQPLKRVSQLDRAAEQLLGARDLGRALRDADYRLVRAFGITAGGNANDGLDTGRLSERQCAAIVDPTFREVGIHRSSSGLAIVLATPVVYPADASAGNIEGRVLELVNEARMHPRDCGARGFAPTHPLTSDPLLDRAALGHAKSMAAFDYMGHVGRDGSEAKDRVERVGYRWRGIGENVAAGPTTADVVVKGWLASPGHCANIMSPKFTQMGIAFAVNRQSRYGVYWAQVFAVPR